MYKYDHYDQAIVDARVDEFRDQVRRRVELRECSPGRDAGLEHGAGFEFGGRRQQWQRVERDVGPELLGWHVDGVDMMTATCRRNQVLSTYQRRSAGGRRTCG